MAETKWTEQQLSAINERSKTLLVSAAAGSGKTATLTERIIRSLTDEENPVNIENILSVTFTTAAAAELKAKLTRALEKACEEQPENKRLRHQLNMLPSAKIRTIDSFCNDILKMGADRVGISPNYRIADGAECELLAVSMLDNLISATYRGELPEVATPEEFEALAECLTDTKRVEELSDVFRLVYSRFDSSECGVDAMLPLIENLNPEGKCHVEETPHGKYLMHICREMLTHYREALAKYKAPLLSGTDAERLYYNLCLSDLAALDAFLKKSTYCELQLYILNLELADLPRMKKGMTKTPIMEEYAEIRNSFKSDLRLKFQKFFIYTEAEWLSSLSGLYKLLMVLYRFEKKFDTLFLEEKKRRGALSYSDVERLCYECLIKDGKPTDIAENLRGRFEALYIDEYQDVNSLQSSIFEAISKPNNRFMVGDIKQSIYGFRLARPEIFASMKASFPPIETSEGDTASIFMSNNFRCDEGIVDFVNGIFDKVFGFVGESIGYEDGDKLKYSKPYEKDNEPSYKAPKVCVVDGGALSIFDDEDADEAEISEPCVVAEKIAELLASGTLNNGKAPEPSDIAIILRSARGKDTLYAEALSARGIPSEISGAKSFFLSSEVLLTLCLLNSIDNPRRDIYLAGLMCSPLFSFTADELCAIRTAEGETLWESLLSYTAAHPDYERGKYFIGRIEYYRTISEGVSVDALISKLYRDSGLMSLAVHSGGSDNLSMLYDYARSYEAGAYKGLYSFISYINSIIDKRTSFDDRRAGSASNAVKIITCHSSKGLEYPIVFLAGANGRFSGQDARGRLVYSADMGITFRQRTPSGLAMVESPIHDLNCHYVLRKQHEEELRILYVALTRAREQLYVVGKAGTKTREAYEKKIDQLRSNLSSYTVRSTSNYLDIIAASMDGKHIYPEEFIESYDLPLTDADEVLDNSSEDSIPEDGFTLPEVCDFTEPSVNPRLVDELTSRFDFKYPREYLTTLPEKFSVSKAHPHLLEPDEGEEELFSEEYEADEALDDLGGSALRDNSEESGSSILEYNLGERGNSAIAENESESGESLGSNAQQSTLEGGKKRRLPAFVVGKEAEESAKRGIATHMVLQFCDLLRMERDGVAAELEALTLQGFISQEDKARVRAYEIKKFLSSELFSRMKKAKKVYRELRFNLLLPATLFTQNEEQKKAISGKEVLVQGVIDCIIEHTDGTLELIDYKTDRLSREELKDRSLAEKKLNEKHSMQLSYYALAVEKMFGKAPSKIRVYSLPLGDTVEIDCAKL